MINTSVNYLLKVNNPYTSSVIFPIKYFEIPIINANYHLKYAPISRYSSILMTDYLVGQGDYRYSTQSQEYLTAKIQEQFADNEFIVIENNSKIHNSNGLLSFKRLDRKSDYLSESLTGNLNREDFQVLDSFHAAWKNSKNHELFSDNKGNHAKRDNTHKASVHQTSLPFYRDKIKELSLATTVKSLRDIAKKLHLSNLGVGLLEHVHSMEISYSLGSFSRELTNSIHLSLIENSMRINSKELEVENTLLSNRANSFDLLISFGVESLRNNKHSSSITWSQKLSERINESSLDIKQALYLANRENEKELVKSTSHLAKRLSLKDFVVEQSIKMAKLKAREYPAHLVFLIRSDRSLEKYMDNSLIESFHRNQLKDVIINNFILSTRNKTSKELTLQQDIRAVRSIERYLHLEDYSKWGVRYNLKHLDISHKFILSNRDIVSNMSILQERFTGERHIIKDLDINRGMVTSTRNIKKELYVQESLLNSVRNIDKSMYVPYELPSSKRTDNRTMSILGNSSYTRDNVSGLYISASVDSKRNSSTGLELGQSSSANRDSLHPFELGHSLDAIRDNKKPTLIHQLTPSERDKVKDLLLGFIGDYIRHKSHDTIIDFPWETNDGGSIGRPILPGYIMEDEIVGELVKDFGNIIESIVLGEQERPLGGQVLDGQIIGAKKRLETFFEHKMLQSSGPSSIAIFNTEHFMGNPIKDGSNINFAEENDLLGGRPLPEGTFEDEMALGYINANPADFLSAEELAGLGLDGGIIENQEEVFGSTESRLGFIGSDVIAHNEKNGIIEIEILANNEKNGIVESEILGQKGTRNAYVDMETYLSSNPQKFGFETGELSLGFIPDRYGIVTEDYWMGTRPDQEGFVEGLLSWGKRPDPKGSIIEDIPQGSVLERYGVTTDNFVEAEKLKWVGILTNILLEADDEKAAGYVEYLQQAGVLKADHFHLLNGLVGDLAEKKGLMFGEELVSDMSEYKADLIENLQGQGLIYDYKDFPTVLEKGMEIEDWDLDLGYGLPENYDPYDPYNLFYPGILDNYSVSSLSLQQLEEWKSFGGGNWEVDNEHGQLRSVASNEKPNGYIVDYYNSTDYVFSVNFKVDIDADGNDGVGVVFKYVNEQNYYKFVISGGPTNGIKMGSNFMQLYKIVNGIQQPIGSSMSPDYWDKGEWYNIRVSYIKKHIQIWVNDRLQYDLIDY